MTWNKAALILTTFLLPILVFAQKQMDEPSSSKDDISFSWKKDNDTLRFIVTNKKLVAMNLSVTSYLDTIDVSSYLLLPKDSLILFQNSGAIADSIYKKEISKTYRLGYTYGHKSVIKPDFDYLYRLPFKEGRRFEISQSFNGELSHRSIKSKYAIDFQLEVGDPVFAAREGIVIDVKDWFTKQGGKELINAANQIIILHSDGTMAFYVHLDYKGILVKEGDTIKREQKIGISGLMGYTTGPHLHFVVRKENNIAIPVYFKGYKNKVLIKGKRYKIL